MPLWNMCSITALIGAKPVPEATKTIGLSESSRRKKGPSGPPPPRAWRPFTRRDVALFLRAEDMVGELPAGDVAHMELDQLGVVRRAGDRKTSAAAGLPQKLDELPRKGKPFF